MPNIQPLFSTLHQQFLVFFSSIYGYKSKFGGVEQECCGYGYCDMLQMKIINWVILINPFKLTKKTKLDAQNNPHLQTFVFGDICVSVQSICAFIAINHANNQICIGLFAYH
jgi:hypothetical protein